MNEYHKIDTVYMRDMAIKGKNIIPGKWSRPEFELLQDVKWTWTEKVDGTNISVHWDGDNATYCGRTSDSQIPNGIVNLLNSLFLAPERKALLKERFPEGGVTFFGEGYGEKIQKIGSSYKAEGNGFAVFDIMIGDLYLERHNVEQICIETFPLDTVPIVATGTLNEAIEYVEKGFKSYWGDFDAEGLVCRPVVELQDRRGRRIIAKIKHRDFLGI